MSPGDIVWIEFPGAHLTKHRPAVILSSMAYHANRPDVIVGLVTSQIGKSTSPTDYALQDWQSAGLRVPSSFRAFLVTLPRTAIVSTMGSVTEQDWHEVKARVKIALDIV